METTKAFQPQELANKFCSKYDFERYVSTKSRILLFFVVKGIPLALLASSIQQGLLEASFERLEVLVEAQGREVGVTAQV